MDTNNLPKMTASEFEAAAEACHGKTLEDINRSSPAKRLISVNPRRILVWDDHLATAIPSTGHSAEDILTADRNGRW